MIRRIFQNELKNKIIINIILYLFIFIAALFVASSVNNILVVSGAMEYCIKEGSIPQENVWTLEKNNTVTLEQWLKTDGRNLVRNYQKNETIVVSKTNILKFGQRDGKEYDSQGSVFISTPGGRYMKMFTMQHRLAQPQKGELSMQKKEMERNGLKAGDKIKLQFGSLVKELTLTEAVYDPAFGGDYIGMTRFLVNQSDFTEFKQAGADSCNVYGIETTDQEQFSKQMNRQGFTVIAEISQDLFKLTYTMNLITAAILIILGVCMIIIAFLILRFIIIVTIQEDFKQIGIMKAIGIRSFGIRRLYLIKYLGISIFAVTPACILSIPVSSLMIGSVASNMMMQDGASHILVNIGCSVLVLILILLFCYFCTGKIKHMSAMDAVRNGQTGERFHAKSLLKLKQSQRIPVLLFLPLNDLQSSMKKYIVLILTFMIGSVLIILPLNTISTMQSGEMAKNFALDVNADFFIDPESVLDKSYTLTRSNAVQMLDSLKDSFKQKGYKTELSTMIFYTLPVRAETDQNDIRNIMAMQFIGGQQPSVTLYSGSLPKYPNEVAISEKVSDKLDVELGDAVIVTINGKKERMVVSGLYANYMQAGSSILVANNLDSGNISSSGNWLISGHLKNSSADKIRDLKNDFSNLTFYDLNQAMENQLGGTISQIGLIKNGIVVLICAVNSLITLLMMKVFLESEKGQMAMLRSIGFTIKKIRLIQTVRMGIILIIGTVTGILLSFPLNVLALRPVFGLLGASRIRIQADAFENYLFYPGILLIVVVLTAYLVSGSVRKLKLMEINNVE